MAEIIKLFDVAVSKILTALCSVLLLLMVIFTVYSIVMRYVFENPPVWGDLLTVLSNIWLVFFALTLTVRNKDHIALDLIYSLLPLNVAFAIQQFWTLVIGGLGVIMIIYGMEAVETMGGKYWEMWYFTWENGTIVFKENYMPKKYAIAIVPISGFLICIAALISVLEDIFRLKAGTYERAQEADL
ncbi:TRAP transporter small permease [Kiloniella sp. EL199]|uniref:TRAP transporter small permease n=1 Tax=Kiloniella sp. EL199 TaxID=2107581 RepID=UPI000EA28D56|nr:TRAP transporter small permease [Kiloniella sp. EL199]